METNTLLDDFQAYNILESSILGDLLHDGGMLFEHTEGKLTVFNHPFKQVADVLEPKKEISDSDLLNLIDKLEENFEVRETSEGIKESDKSELEYLLALTTYNVWNIESTRLDSDCDELIELSQKYYTKLRQ